MINANKPLKIGITCYPTYGGSGVVATELGKALAARGHQVHFISYALPFRLDGFHENIYFHEVELPDYPLFEVDLYSLSLTSKMVDVGGGSETAETNRKRAHHCKWRPLHEGGYSRDET